MRLWIRIAGGLRTDPILELINLQFQVVIVTFVLIHSKMLFAGEERGKCSLNKNYYSLNERIKPQSVGTNALASYQFSFENITTSRGVVDFLLQDQAPVFLVVYISAQSKGQGYPNQIH